MNGQIVFAGSRAQRPGRGGQTWVFLQYLLGFRRLGFDVLYLDTLQVESCVDREGKPCGIRESWNLRYFLDVMKAYRLEDNYSLICDNGAQVFGLPREEVLDRVKDSLLLINVMGFLRDDEILSAASRRAFLDIDPGFGQMWCDLGYADVFAGHDDFITIGENIGRPDCIIPTCGLNWITTPQPVVLEHWPACRPVPEGNFTSVASWRGAYGPIEYQQRTYGLRVHEFRKFLELPQRSGQSFEVALDIHPGDVSDLQSLRRHGWQVVHPREVAGDPAAYQAFIRRSKAEFQVAKNIYVQTRSGWFSDRTLCYLASGKPALVQDTGLAGLIPTGEGLLTFTTPAEAAEGVQDICQDYERHAVAARQLAEQYFDSDKVLARLLFKLNLVEHATGKM